MINVFDYSCHHHSLQTTHPCKPTPRTPDEDDEEPPVRASDSASEGGTEPAPSPDEAGACESEEPPPLSSFSAPLFKFDPSDP